ncbi:hypothetical protein MMC07_003023 [Pseudocyphellaria aurata]|nr:hypothetical protein [Pseudocyphellaria aurata]
MSSAHFPWPLLYIFLPLPILAGQPFTGSLPAGVAQVIPTCAQKCVQSFIANEFATSICSPLDLHCLCTSNSSSGFTLGEGSLRCVVTTCADADLFEEKEYQAYGICLGYPNAKPMTHGTLTATKSSNPTGSISTWTASSQRETSFSSSHSRLSTPSRSWTSSSNLSTIRTSETISTAVSSTQVSSLTTSRSPTSRSSTSSSFRTSLLTTTHSSTIASRSPTSSVSAPASATSSPAPLVAGPAPALSKGKIAGVAIGVSFAALAFAGILFFYYSKQRRRSSRRDSGSFFGGDGTFTSHPDSPALYHPIAAQFERNNRSRDLTLLESQDGRITPIGANRSPESFRRDGVQHEIGVAWPLDATPKPSTAASPMSFKSSRTASRPSSRLLPDKPVYSLYPAPLRINHSVSPESPGGGVVPGAAGVGQKGAMPLSKAAPRGPLSSDTSQGHPSASDPFLDPRSDSSMNARQRSQAPQSEEWNYGRPNPEALYNGQWTQSLNDLRKPVPARQSSSARTLTRQQAVKASISPSDYTGRPMFDFPPQLTTIPRKPVPRRRSAPRRSATHYSSASETSFEDAGDDAAANLILSPVAESPAMRSGRRQATSPNIYGSLSSAERRSEPESPTRRPTRRKQPPSLPMSAAAPRPLKSSLKPLPEVPANSDSSTPLLPTRRGDHVPTPIMTGARDSPRGETELTKSAKWKILVSPGLHPIEQSGTPRSGRSSEWTPNTPTRRDEL